MSLNNFTDSDYYDVDIGYQSEDATIERTLIGLSIDFLREDPSWSINDNQFHGLVSALEGSNDNYALSLSLMEDHGHPGISAARTAVKALEKVRYGGEIDVDYGADAATCPIWLDELVSGMELTRMPCSHMFHGDCIMKWLEKSNTCPMWRSELPNNSI